MKLSGALQLIYWHARLQLRKSNLLRTSLARARRLLPDTRERHLRLEVRYWRRWFATEGLEWPEDYKMRFDPAAPVQAYLAEVIDRVAGARVELLDVGAGPLTKVGKVHPTKKLTVTATDVLGREYGRLLDEFGLTPQVRTIYAPAEALREQIGSRQFDIVHACNSLDHSADPFAGIEEMLALARPGGFVVLLHEEEEGRREQYYALHKWDFSCLNGRFTISGPGPGGPTRDVSSLLEGRAEVECVVDGEQVLVVIRKKPEAAT